jgi:8-oxo-dGTP pyrophosphatase MutT (NUDIX family)
MISIRELKIEVEAAGISAWKKPWSNRSARVTLLVDFGDRFVIIADPRSGSWFLPGGGVEQNESIEEAAKREAVEELGLGVNVSRTIATFDVTLISKDTGEHLKIPPFAVVHATPTEGKLKEKYAPNRKILLVTKDESSTLLHNSEVPSEYEWMKPYFCVSREVIREFLR